MAIIRMRKFFFKQMVGLHFSRWKTVCFFKTEENRREIEAQTQYSTDRYNDRVGVINDANILKAR